MNLAELKQKTPAKRADFEQKKRELMARLQNVKADDALVNYMARLRAAAGERISVEYKLLEAGKEENQKGNAPEEE